MSARDAAVRAVAEALGSPTANQWRGAYGAIPPDADAWHYEFDADCSYDVAKAARIAIAALATSADVRAGLVAAYDERMPCLVYPEDWQCGDGGNLSTIDHPRHAQCVVAHLLAALGGAG